MKTKKLIQFVCCLAALSLSGCVLFRNHQLDVQQGNIIDHKKAMQVHEGMSKSQVRFLMGDPLMQNVFNPNRWEYVYMDKKVYHGTHIERMIVQFSGDKVTSVTHS